MQQYDFQVAANTTFPIASQGRYIKYVSGNNGGGDVSLVVTPSGQGAAKVVLVPGQAFRVSETGPTPSGWVLSNAAGGAAISGKVVIGDGRIDDPTINGTVQVVDGGKARTIGNNAYTGYAYQTVGGAGFYSEVQLWNPATNTNRLVVESVLASCSSGAQNPHVRSSNVVLPNFVVAGQAKKLGGSVSNAGLYIGTTNVADGEPILAVMNLAVSTTQQYKPVEPIVVPPGYGLLIFGASGNTDLSATFEWYEEPNV